VYSTHQPANAAESSIGPRAGATSDRQLDTLIDWIGQVVEPATERGALVPVSGGSDSALCFWLCARALPPGRAIALYVGSALRCREWFESIGTLLTLDEPPRTADIDGEVFRWAMTVTQARAHRGWVTGSRNRTEDVFGTYSLASRVCTLFPLAGLWKSQVMELCEAVGVPQEITQSSRQADPACGRPQEMADIPFSQVDLFLQAKVGERPERELLQLDENQLKYLECVYQRNQFKRHLPLRPPITAL
jgi:NAD+ synthase